MSADDLTRAEAAIVLLGYFSIACLIAIPAAWLADWLDARAERRRQW